MYLIAAFISVQSILAVSTSAIIVIINLCHHLLYYITHVWTT